MKAYKILLTLAMAVVLSGCYEDNTNRYYKTVDLPRIDNPENDLALFVENRAYKVKLQDHLVITPNVVYKDMNDLSYTWIIDGKTVAKTKDIDWVCDLEKARASGVFIVHRNSAGNAKVFAFSVELDQPYITGYNLLVEKDGALRYDFISYALGQPYTFAYNENAALYPLAFTPDSKPRMEEYWSCEKAAITGEMMFLDENPANCISFNGETLDQAMTLPKEFIEERLPQNFRVKDFMHGGFVSYLLADDGRIFQRKCGRIYYTGRFSDLPMQYKGKQLIGEKLVNTKYNEGFGLIYDKTEGSGRFLLVNLDYETGETHPAAKAGQILEFPESSKMSGITGYDLIDCWFVLNADAMANPRTSSVLALFRNQTDGKYYLREVKIKFDSRTSSVTTTEVYSKMYRELPDFGPDSKTCVIRTDGGTYFESGYFYYTPASDPRQVMVTKRTSTDAPTLFHTFDEPVVSIVEGTMTRRSCYMLFAEQSGAVTMYAMLSEHLTPSRNFLTFEEERVVGSFTVDGTLRWAGFKFGSFANFK